MPEYVLARFLNLAGQLVQTEKILLQRRSLSLPEFGDLFLSILSNRGDVPRQGIGSLILINVAARTKCTIPKNKSHRIRFF